MGYTALRIASKNGNIELLKLLMEFGASVHEKDNVSARYCIVLE